MRIIDRYILRQFAQMFVICFLSISGLFIVFHCFTHVDEFLRYAETQGNLLALVAEFYGYRMLFFLDRLGGVLALIAAMFTVTWIQRHQEITALMAAGISKGRIVAPILGAALAVSVVSAANRELLIPRFSEQLSRDPNDLQGEVGREVRPRYDHRSDILFRGRQTFAKERRIELPRFLFPRALHGWARELAAENAFYEPPANGRPGGYRFRGVTEPRDVAKLDACKLPDGQLAVLTSKENGWLAADECFVVSEINFEQLTGGTNWRKYSSTAELIRGLYNPSLDFGADVRVDVHFRFVRPLLDMTLLFLGLPLVLARENRNLYLAIAMCVAAVAGFQAAILGCQYLGQVYFISPALAAWLPLLIGLPVAAWQSEPLLA
jgi:lipopolysaccharide export system permease protein